MSTEPIKRKTSEDFHVGQRVYCPRPDDFIRSLADYLRGREGVVIWVAPARRPNPQHAGHVNMVEVEWQKRGNRGTKKVRMTRPEDLAVVLGEHATP